MTSFPTPVGTSDEHRQVSGGMVDSIHREVKQRFFLQIPEMMRIRVDVRHLVGQIRGEQYVQTTGHARRGFCLCSGAYLPQSFLHQGHDCF